jgi:vitamin B12 transporter
MKNSTALRSLALLVSIAMLAPGIVAARMEAQQPDTVSLRTVVVSATKGPVSRNELTQSVTVISGAELRARGVARVSDALQLVPGATLAQNGSFGSVSSLFLRGGESRYTKVLIDGVAVNESGGFFDFSHLTTDNIDRIEVVRGPASVLYGADAVTGIIQIFTREGRGPLSLSAGARGGTYGTVDTDAGVSGSSNGVAYSLAGAAHRSDGILRFNNEYYNGTVSGSLALAPRATTSARVSARYTNAEFHYPTDYTGAPVDSNSYRVQHRLTAGFDAVTVISPSIRARILGGTNEVSDLSEDIAVPFGAQNPLHSAALSRGYRRTGEARLEFSLPASATLSVGGEYVREHETSTDSEGPVGPKAVPVSTFAAERSNRAAYAELIGSLAGRVAYTAAARIDDNSDYKSYATYRLGMSVPVAGGTRLRGSLGTAFNAPAFSQLWPTLYTVGSPDLTPEHSSSWEAGVEHALESGYGRMSASYFNQRFDDLIQYVAGGPPSFKGGYANLAQARSNGYEATIEVTPPGIVSASASLTQANPRVTRISPAYSGDLTVGAALIRRPTHSATASLAVSPRWGSFSVVANRIGKRPDVDFVLFPSPTVTLPAYTRLDASASVDVWKSENGSSLALTGRAENAFGAKYETVLHFPAPGRVLLVGARFSGSL